MKGLGLLTNPSVAGRMPEQAASAEQAGTKNGSPATGLASASASFIKELDRARTASTEPIRTPVERPAERTETRPETRSEESREKPAETVERKADRRPEDSAAKSREKEPRAQNEKDADRERVAARKNEDEAEKTVRTEKSDSKDQAAEETEAVAERKQAGGEKKIAGPELWNELASKLEQWQPRAEAGEQKNERKQKQDSIEVKEASARKAGEQTESPAALLDRLIAKTGPQSEKTETRNHQNEAKGDAKNDAARETKNQAPAVERESVIEKNARTTLDPTKWSVQGAQANRSEQAREGEAKNKNVARNAGLRLDPVARPTEEASAREGGSQGQGQQAFDREFSALRQDAAARLLQNSEARSAALRESRELFNSLVQKARVNLGSEGRSTATIRLKPEFLGNMTLNLKVNGKQIEAVLLVDNKAAMKLLGDEMEHMRQELKLAGIQVESFAIKVREPNMSAALGDPNAESAGTDANSSADQGRDRGDERGGETDVRGMPAAVGGETAEAEYESHLSANEVKAGVDLAV